MGTRDLSAVRRENLKRLVEARGGPSSLAKLLGHAGPSFLSQLTTGRRIVSEKIARGIEDILGLPLGTLDVRPGERVPFEGTDHALIASCVRAVGAELERAKIQASSQKFAELVALVYERAVVTGAVDLEHLRKILILLR